MSEKQNKRSREYFAAEKRGRKNIAAGGYDVRMRKPKIVFCGSFAEYNKWKRTHGNRKYRTVLQFPAVHVSFTEKCNKCGKDCDGLMTCTYVHDGSTIKLCPDCMEDSGFCFGCGLFCSGQSSFDFSSHPGYCTNCIDELRMDADDEEMIDRICDPRFRVDELALYPDIQIGFLPGEENE